MKKLFALLAAVLMVLCLAGCGETESNEGTAKEVTIGVTIYQFNDNFMTLYRNDIEAYFDELNESQTDVHYNVQIVDANNDMATQTEQVNTFIAQKVDAMIVNLVQTSTGAEISKLCAESGIPTVFINREIEGFDWPEGQCYVGAKAQESGTYQGMICYAQPNHGDINGDGVVKYVMIMGDPENSDAQYRTEYSIKYLVEDAEEKVDVECVVQQTGNWDQAQGQEIASTALAADANKDIDVIFCNNDGMALGAYQAIVSAGRVVGTDIYLLGVDALGECVQMVNDGTMTGTVLNDDNGQATKCCEAVLDLLAGNAIEKTYYVPYISISAVNVADYMYLTK